MRRHRLLVGCVALLLMGCTQTSISAQPPINISIAGSTSFSPVLFDLTEAFVAQNPNVTFDLRGGGSRFGEEQLRDSKVDFAASTYLLGSDAGSDAGSGATGERPAAASANVDLSATQNNDGSDGAASGGGQGDAELVADGDVPPAPPASAQLSPIRIPIALDGLALIVNQNNRLASLSLTQLQEIYNGRILDWSDVDGTPGEIQLVVREDDSGAQALFEERVMGDKSVSLTAVIMPSNLDVLQYVAVHPTAIGYLSRGYITQRIEAGNRLADQAEALNQTGVDNQVDAASATVNGEPAVEGSGYLEPYLADQERVRAVSIDGQLPTAANISDQTYLLIQPLYLESATEPTGWQALFIDFVLSPSGQAIVSRYHIPVR